ncbi:TPA: ATP-binding protein [Campylobacter coli]|nr:ATP-binding protein [Campylobacter coli]
MLIEFRVENFLSIQDEQVLSMMASKDNTFFGSHTNGDEKLTLLKSSVIYGANAAGKSNIIKALAIMKTIVVFSAKQQRGDKLPVTPFLLGDEGDKPTKFEIIFIQNNTRYQYGFILNSEKILEEWLLVFGESNRAQKWFERIYNEKEGKSDYSFGTKFLGSKQLWAENTRDNALFLSVAIQLNNEQLKPVFDFFLNNLKVTCGDKWGDGKGVTIDILKKDKQKIIDYIKIADLDIEDINLKEQELDVDKIKLPILPKEIKQAIQVDLEKGTKLTQTNIHTIHTNQRGELVTFDMETSESQGTKKFFNLIGPWIEALKNGYTVVVDELHTHMHPLMTKFLINLFHNEDLNKSNAQLIFTTHDTSILNQDVFRRDQIWFCEKQNKATKLYPLSDFKVRKDKTNLENDYLLGRFGALPYFKEILSSWSDNGN